MTVTIPAKNDMPKTDANANETTYKSQEHDHTESLLENLKKNDEVKTLVKATSTTGLEDFVNSIKKPRRLLNVDEVPPYMQHNSFILTGYRGLLNTQLCIESLFWWTNETINIWSHIFGLVLFLGLEIYDLLLLKVHAAFGDKLIVAVLLLCFQACMFLSALYHTFSCRSEEDCYLFLTFDLLGVALSLLAIYTSGIYYAFYCHPKLSNFYLSTVTLIFCLAMAMQLPSFQFGTNARMVVFVLWALYGVVPTLHWTVVMGGLANPMVSLLLPRVFGMYIISGSAFLIYVTKVPERFFAGKFDFLGHSHQWWHIFVLGALYYWHNTGMMYVEYRMNHACTQIVTCKFRGENNVGQFRKYRTLEGCCGVQSIVI